jgi:hypothetical protein
MRLSQAIPAETSIVLADGQRYIFSGLNLNAQAAVEEKYGITLIGETDGRVGLDVFLSEMLPKTSTLRFISWQLLRKHHRDLEEEDVGYLISPDNQGQVLHAVMLAIANSLPISDDKKKEVEIAMGEALAPLLAMGTTGQ